MGTLAKAIGVMGGYFAAPPRCVMRSGPTRGVYALPRPLPPAVAAALRRRSAFLKTAPELREAISSRPKCLKLSAERSGSADHRHGTIIVPCDAVRETLLHTKILSDRLLEDPWIYVAADQLPHSPPPAETESLRFIPSPPCAMARWNQRALVHRRNVPMVPIGALNRAEMAG